MKTIAQQAAEEIAAAIARGVDCKPQHEVEKIIKTRAILSATRALGKLVQSSDEARDWAMSDRYTMAIGVLMEMSAEIEMTMERDTMKIDMDTLDLDSPDF